MEIQSIAQQFYDYATYFKGYSKATIKRYKYVIDLYCKLANIKTIDQVSHENVRDLFFHGRTIRHWTSNTFIVFHKSLHVFCQWCKDHGYLDFNPVENIEKPKLEQKLPRKLTSQDALRLLEIVFNYPYQHTFLRYRNHAMFATFLFTGLRLNELLNLKYTDVDLKNLTIFVHLGKDNKDRIVPINPTLENILKQYAEQRKDSNKTCPEFFASLQGNRGFTENGLKHLVAEIRRASNISFSIHQLRHTFATLMLEGGCDIYSLSKMMGHTNIKTTTIYLSATTEHLKLQILKHPLN